MNNLNLVDSIKARQLQNLGDEDLKELFCKMQTNTCTKQASKRRRFLTASTENGNSNPSFLQRYVDRITIHNPNRSVEDPNAKLLTVFAIAYESIRRRLGTWRLFDLAYEDESLSYHRQLAQAIVDQGSYRSIPDYSTNSNFLSSPGFLSALEPVFDELNLSSDDQDIVTTLVVVYETTNRYGNSEILLPSSFYAAIGRSNISRVLDFVPTGEQILAGQYIYEGKIVEMSAGEGKTIAAVFPSLMHVADGNSVHVITSNDYLALRDVEMLLPIYKSVGISCRAIVSSMNDTDRREAYDADIVYGTVRELGFDFLRDNLRKTKQEMVQGRRDVAIIDEADQVLIDESSTPLIISSGPSASRRAIHKTDAAVRDLISIQKDVAHKMIMAAKSTVTGKEIRNILAALHLADPTCEYLTVLTSQDRKLAKKIRTDAIDIIEFGDESTYSDSLYYFLSVVDGTVTLTEKGLDFIDSRLGPTFDTSKLEEKLKYFAQIRGQEDPPVSHETGRIQREITRRDARRSQVQNALRARLLLHRDIDYIISQGQVILIDELTGRARPETSYQHGLNAALEAKEGVAIGGERQVAARISTHGFLRNYSILGGMSGTALSSSEELARSYGLEVIHVSPTHPSRRIDLPTRIAQTLSGKLQMIVEEVKKYRQEGHPILIGTFSIEQSEQISKVLHQHNIDHQVLNAVNSSSEDAILSTAGRPGAVTVATNMAGRGIDIVVDSYPGLHVIGTEMNPSRRIDDQLRGRAGRQGKPGSTQFVLSMEDQVTTGRPIGTDLPSNNNFLSSNLDKIQRFSTLDAEVQRAISADYDRVLENQTLSYYSLRSEIMDSNNIYEKCVKHCEIFSQETITTHFEPSGLIDYENQFDNMSSYVSLNLNLDCEELWGLSREDLFDGLHKLIIAKLSKTRISVGEARFNAVAKTVLLQAGDSMWRDHLVKLDDFIVSVNLSSQSHRAAVAEFQVIALKEYDEFLANLSAVFLQDLITTIEAASHSYENIPVEINLPAKLAEIMI